MLTPAAKSTCEKVVKSSLFNLADGDLRVSSGNDEWVVGEQFRLKRVGRAKRVMHVQINRGEICIIRRTLFSI